VNSSDRQQESDRDGFDNLCREILRYLADHPRARDTLEGILEWWLLERDIRRESSRVEQALTHLVDCNEIVVSQGPDGRRHYTLNPARPEGG
jgi:hypothetical protein